MSGVLTKLIIQAVKSPGGGGILGKVAKVIDIPGLAYITMFNPKEYTRNFKINKNTAVSTDGKPQNAGSTKEQPEFTLTFTIDSTGATDSLIAGIPFVNDVTLNIQWFLKVCFDQTEGGVKTANPLKIIWGSMLIHAELISAEVKYTLFRPDGTPIRAIVTAKFEETGYNANFALAAGIVGAAGDLTKKLVVKKGDTLPKLAQDVYGSADMFLELAKANGLDNFRNLKPGTEITFPPIDKN